MSRFTKSRKALPRSAVHPPFLLARYRSNSRTPNLWADFGLLLAAASDHAQLVRRGQLEHAIGAALEMVDLTLRMASTPASDERDLAAKAQVLRDHVPPLVRSHQHGRVVAIAEAAMGLEWRLPQTRPDPTTRGRPPRDSLPPLEVEFSLLSAAIPDARLLAYAAAARMSAEEQGHAALMRKFGSDRDVLLREGRIDAAWGADHLLAVMLRRLCATATSSEREAADKVRLLAWAKDDRLASDAGLGRDGRSSALVTAMVDAAIAIETEAWPTPPAPGRATAG